MQYEIITNTFHLNVNKRVKSSYNSTIIMKEDCVDGFLLDILRDRYFYKSLYPKK